MGGAAAKGNEKITTVVLKKTQAIIYLLNCRIGGHVVVDDVKNTSVF